MIYNKAGSFGHPKTIQCSIQLQIKLFAYSVANKVGKEESTEKCVFLCSMLILPDVCGHLLLGKSLLYMPVLEAKLQGVGVSHVGMLAF